jgi:RHS repeat-associated protein
MSFLINSAVALNENDKHPFGMLMPERKYSSSNSYRYGFNGQEKDNEIKGEGNSYYAENWQYDPRIGRRWNVDPVMKPYESSYSAFANNPIENIDPYGSDTVNITRTTTFDSRQCRPPSYSHAGLGWMKSKLLDPGNSGITTSGNINIIAAEGADVFIFNDVHTYIDANGKESTVSSSSTTLNIRGKENSGYRQGGNNIKGYTDDRYALADMAPGWLLDHYANNNKNYDSPTEWGLRSAKAYQKDVRFANVLQKVSNTIYIITGTYGIARMTLGAVLATTTEGTSFFAGTKYSSKVWKQMQLGDFHSFPEGIKAFEKYGIRSFIKGGDEIEREMLKIPGSYKGKSGYFEFIKEADGSINHRLFNPN